MAAASASASLSLASLSAVNRNPSAAAPVYGLGSFSGLKNRGSGAGSLALPVCTHQQFARVLSSVRSKPKVGRGGAMSSRCDAAGEIFRIAAIINGLVLVGVAVGFVLLRVEAWVEDSEAAE